MTTPDDTELRKLMDGVELIRATLSEAQDCAGSIHHELWVEVGAEEVSLPDAAAESLAAFDRIEATVLRLMEERDRLDEAETDALIEGDDLMARLARVEAERDALLPVVEAAREAMRNRLCEKLWSPVISEMAPGEREYRCGDCATCRFFQALATIPQPPTETSDD